MFLSKEFRNLGRFSSTARRGKSIYFLDSLVLTPKGMSVAMQSLDQENTRSFFSGAQRSDVFAYSTQIKKLYLR